MTGYKSILDGPIWNLPQDIAVVATNVGEAMALAGLAPASEQARLRLCLVGSPPFGRRYSKVYATLDLHPSCRTPSEAAWFAQELEPHLPKGFQITYRDI